MNKQRIAIMVPDINNGGAEKVAADLSIYFEQKSYKVFIFVESRQKCKDYPYGGKLVYVNRKAGICASNDKADSFSKLMQDVDSYRKLKKKYQIDITISFMQTSNLLNILSRYNDKVVVTLHSVMSYRKDLYNSLGYDKNIFRFLYQLADKIVLVSRFCQKDWIDHYGDMLSKTLVIQNPINCMSGFDFDNTKSFEKKLGSNVIISVARLSGVKQQWHLIRAFKKVLCKCSDAQLLIAGEGILKDALKNLSIQLGLEKHVYFLGFVTEVEKYLQKSRVIVVTSQSESWCNAVAEAMLQGVPVVTNDCPGGIRELLGAEKMPKPSKDNVIVDCGIITPKLDGQKYTSDDPLTREESLLADGILCILEDDDLRQKMSKRCIENVKKYELKKIGKKWEQEVIETVDRKTTRLILRIIMEVFCGFSGFLSNNYIRKGSNNINVKQNINNDKFVSYYNILERWICLKEDGVKIEKFFLDRGYRRIAIYGMAKMANHLIRELEFSAIEVVYGIDERANVIYSKFPVISPNEPLSEVDAIIVTPIFDYNNIEKQLRSKVLCPIISLEDIIYYYKA